MLSNNANASAYAAASIISSICSPHGFILNDHIVLPAAVAAARSVGVVTM